MTTNNHTWSFSTIGGVKRVNLESGADLMHLSELDPKLWNALSCPVDGLEIDRKTLELIDTDHDGHIHVPEVTDAVNWILSAIKNPDDLLKQSPSLPLSAIDEQTETGKALLDSAHVILKNLGKEQETSLSVADTSDTVAIFSGSRFNGDGIITEDTMQGNADLIALLADIIQYAGSATDRNGKAGISSTILESFFEQCEKYNNWQLRKEAAAASILPFGEDTTAAYNNCAAIKAKVDDFFIRCRLAAFDPSSAEKLNLQAERVATITDNNLADCLSEIATYPIANVSAGGQLPLSAGINPAWEGQVGTFLKATAQRLFPGKTHLSESDWGKVASTFAPYEQWNKEKEGEGVEQLGITRIRSILSGGYKATLEGLIEQDKAMEPQADNIILVDKLVRYYRDIFVLLKNFVTFYDFYTPGGKAIFQAGTLYIDQRSCDLCIKVADMGRQGTMAPNSGMYLIYCDCMARSGKDKMVIVAALTNGDVDDLMVGRNALFFDRNGHDWDATISKIVENPTSIRQAFFAPYRTLSRMVETQINKAAAAADEKNKAQMSKGVEKAPDQADDTKKPAAPPQPPFDVAKFAGIFAAIGLAIGAIGTTLAAVVGGFMKLTWWKMPLAILGILLIISGPSMVLAYIKLRKRNLAPILDANGWAINARVKINIAFGRTLTHLAELPRGARINLNDPFTKKKRPFLPIFLLLCLIAGIVLYFLWKNGVIHIRLPR